MLAASTLYPISTEQVFETGRRKPILARCREVTDAGTNSFISVVMKTRNHDFPPERAIVEALAAQWASWVGLYTPMCWLVDITEEQAQILSRSDRKVHPGLAFASEHLEGVFQVTVGTHILPDQGAKILAFDAAIQNADRSRHNSNCILYKNLPYVIDHEASMDFFVESLSADPDYGLDYVFVEHLFLPQLGEFLKQRRDFRQICESVSSIDSKMLGDLRKQLELTFAARLGWEQLLARLDYLKQNVGKSVKDLSFLASR